MVNVVPGFNEGDSIDDDTPTVNGFQVIYAAQQGALAAPAGPEDEIDLTPLYPQADVGKRLHLIEGLVDIPDDDDVIVHPAGDALSFKFHSLFHPLYQKRQREGKNQVKKGHGAQALPGTEGTSPVQLAHMRELAYRQDRD